VIFGGAAFGGKRLCIKTPIPTPDGWKAMGELKDGDKVLDDSGLPCTVTKAHPIAIEEDAYRLTFDDGQVIYAGADHLWQTFTKKDLGTSNHGQVRTTNQILKTLRTRGGKPNHYILNAKPLSFHPKAYGLSLYALGKNVVEVCGQYQGREFVLDQSYLRGSFEQRLELLQGIMDAGGLACLDGSLKFITTSQNLSEIVAELVHSLGSKTKSYTRPKALSKVVK
jgi:replicative DNA helicase